MSLLAVGHHQPAKLAADRESEGTAARLSFRTLQSFEDAEPYKARWDELAQRLGSPLHASFDWCRIWWRHYGARRQLRLMLFESGGELVAVVPLFVERIGFWPVGVRLAKLVASDFTLGVCDLSIEASIADEVFDAVLAQVFERDRCDALHVGPVCGGAWQQLEALRTSINSNSSLVTAVRDSQTGNHTVFRLDDGFDQFLADLSKNQRSNYRRNLNKLDNAFEFSVDTVTNPADAEGEFTRFLDMHRRQWESVGNLGHFGDWPGATGFHRELVREFARAGRLRLLRLTGDGDVLAYYYCFAFAGAWHWRLPARKVGEPWDQYALGRVGLLKMLEAAAADGVVRVEAGMGEYDYKEKLNAQSLPVRSVVVSRRGLGSRLRLDLLMRAAAVLHTVYYKVWFCRLAFRLPLPRRPLRSFWVRTRF